MALNLPNRDTDIRDMIDVHHLAQIADPINRHKLSIVAATIDSANAVLDKDKVIDLITSYCIGTDNQLWLIHISRNDWKLVWNFGVLP